LRIFDSMGRRKLISTARGSSMILSGSSDLRRKFQAMVTRPVREERMDGNPTRSDARKRETRIKSMKSARWIQEHILLPQSVGIAVPARPG
jgi:hypothetical protein